MKCSSDLLVMRGTNSLRALYIFKRKKTAKECMNSMNDAKYIINSEWHEIFHLDKGLQNLFPKNLAKRTK